MNKVLKIPKADEKEVFTIPKGRLGDIEQKFKKMDQLVFGILVAVILAMVAVIVSVFGLFLDQMRYNNAAYRDYSEKIEIISVQKEINQSLLEENKKNQQLIIEKQKQLERLLQKNLQ